MSKSGPTISSTSYDGSDSEESCVSDDSAKRITLPVLKYGYRTEYFEWEELVDIITIQKDLAKLSRSVEQQKEYEIHKRDLLLEWRSVYDYVLCSKFVSLFEKKIDAGTGLAYADPPIQDVKCVETTLVKNDFPYYMADGIEHWVLWKIGGGPCTEKEISGAKDKLKKERFEEVIHWINPPHLKSLPDIDHVHILGKCRK